MIEQRDFDISFDTIHAVELRARQMRAEVFAQGVTAVGHWIAQRFHGLMGHRTA